MEVKSTLNYLVNRLFPQTESCGKPSACGFDLLMVCLSSQLHAIFFHDAGLMKLGQAERGGIEA